MPHAVHYQFSQRFDVPARKAYEWCTDYDAEDIKLMGGKGRRSIKRISDDTVILVDTHYLGKGRRTRKKRLVQLYPRQMSWTNTHLIGPHKYSQFLYSILPEGKSSSRLDFTALELQYDLKNPTAKCLSSLASRLRKADSGAWKILARAMEKDLKKH